MIRALLFNIFLYAFCVAEAQTLTFVELNCENLFDCRHDSLKQDLEFLPDGSRHWTKKRYWTKLNNIGREILSCSDELPDIVALIEVENDTVAKDLTRRSLLRNAGYHYLMTESADVRGLDIALLYQPTSLRPLCYESISVPVLKGMRPTRDILYIRGEVVTGDTLHLFIIHAPSRYGGELETRPYRKQAVETLRNHITTIGQGLILVAGDFNDYAESTSLRILEEAKLENVTRHAKGRHGAKGNYRYHGEWHSLDHVFLSPGLKKKIDTVYVNDADFLLEDEPTYGGKRPKRTFSGYKYQPGFSDHLPLVVRLRL